ncbi:hypothetical protein [Pseudarthrobacter sp. NamE2]|uniref:hypothetical protein n=1 Tax=Pseudarthrobacter sp. NamE2 TaxID=2576838 RepID=UPI00197AE81B|nr:hypothetical protein [Pseudarthrobacter sp. NamE2]
MSVCAGLPGLLVGWAALDDPYGLTRHLAAVASFPLALAGIAEVIRARPPAAGLSTRQARTGSA